MMKTEDNRKYTCAICKKEFDRTRPDEEAIKEMQQNFGEDLTEEDSVEVCEKCFRAVTINGKPIIVN